jgi:hypothetical protein
MEAQRDLSTRKTDQVAAVKAHLDRMRKLEEGSIIRDRLRRVSRDKELSREDLSMLPKDFRSSV